MLFVGNSDRYVELAMGGTSVAQIFEQRGEGFFRDHEVSWNTVHLCELQKLLRFSFYLFLSLLSLASSSSCYQFMVYHFYQNYNLFSGQKYIKSTKFSFCLGALSFNSHIPFLEHHIPLLSGFNIDICLHIIQWDLRILDDI
jgi:hypothetical protein